MTNKVCTKCKESKKLSDFGLLNYAKDKLQYSCKECMREYGRKMSRTEKAITTKEAYYSRTVERRAYRQKKYDATRKESSFSYGKEYRASNQEKIKASGKEYRQNNKGLVNAKTARRRSRKVSSTPVWANDDKIQSKYAFASFLTVATFGKGYHVDHIVPLQGKDVCGLHVENNLQVLRAEHNLSKGNSHAGH